MKHMTRTYEPVEGLAIVVIAWFTPNGEEYDPHELDVSLENTANTLDPEAIYLHDGEKFISLEKWIWDKLAGEEFDD